jgi:hypothetical protein
MIALSGVFARELHGDRSGSARNGDVDLNAVLIVARKVDETAVSDRSGDCHRLEFHALAADVAQAFDARDHLRVLDARACCSVENRDNEMLLVRSLLGTAMHGTLGVTGRMTPDNRSGNHSKVNGKSARRLILVISPCGPSRQHERNE